MVNGFSRDPAGKRSKAYRIFLVHTSILTNDFKHILTLTKH